MDKVLFKNLKPGDIILSLEMNRRMLCPVFEVCRVLRIGEEYTGRVNDDKFSRLLKLELLDSNRSNFEISVEPDHDGSIYDKVYYTTSPESVYNEVLIQKQKAEAILQNHKKYEACIEECNSILAKLSPEEPSNKQDKYVKSADVKSLIQEEVKNILDPISKKIDSLYNSLMSNENKKEDNS